jgi:hypothetical protein
MTAISHAGATRPRLTCEDVVAAREVSDLLGISVSTKLGRRGIFLRDEIEAAVRGAPPVARAPTQLAPRGPLNGVRKGPSGTRHKNGARGTRTPDLLGAIQALSQLSYSPLRAPVGGARSEV